MSRKITMKAFWQLLLYSVLQEKQKFKLMLYGGLKGPHPDDSTQRLFTGRFKHLFCLDFTLVFAYSLLRLVN